jgi:hypothetical protein
VDWPPTLADMRAELKRESSDTSDDTLLVDALDAAIEFVTDVKGGQYNVASTTGSLLPSPGPRIALGTVRLAVRLHTRRRSPDGLIDLGEFGQTRVPSFDPDIDRLLGIGRWAGPVIA